MAGALAMLLEPWVLGIGLVIALRAFDARRFPRNAWALGGAGLAALAARAALAPILPFEPSSAAAACAADAAGLAHAVRGARRWPAWLAAAALASAGVLSPGEPVARLVGLLVGAAVVLFVLRRLEIVHGLAAPTPLPPPARRAAGEPLRVLLVAGEASGDRWGAQVLAELRAREPGVVAWGIGGARLRAEGLRCVADSEALGIVGFTGVAARLPRLAALYRRLVAELERQRPDVLVAIDLPDWNALLALQARARAVPTLFFIAPQVWAWRAARAARLAERISRLVVLFPFEIARWERAGVAVVCHGHPLADELAARDVTRAQARARLGVDPSRPLLALAPGSRASELAQHLGPLLDAAARVRAELPALALALPVASEACEDPLRAAIEASGLEVVLVRDAAFELFLAADFGLVCSGTATLEAAFAGLPMAIFYRGHPLNAALARRLVRVDRIGLPNLLLGGPEPVFPELFQEDVTGERLAATALGALRDPARLAELRGAGARVRALLPARATAAAVALEILALAGGAPPPARAAPGTSAEEKQAGEQQLAGNPSSEAR
jgi:lipid-A-disaccharide synthase